MFVDKLFTYLICGYLKKQKMFLCEIFNYYFHMKTKVLPDFQICVSVPLMSNGKMRPNT